MGTINLGKVIGPPSNTGATGPVGPKGNDGSIGPAGERGLRGKSFDPDATGLESGRSAYDNQPVGFSYLATDTKLIYWREDTGWSIGIPFGGSISVEPTFIPIVLELTDEEVVVGWGEDLSTKHGTRPTIIELWETEGDNQIRSTSPCYCEDGGLSYRFYVGTIDSPRTWEVRIFGYTESELPDPPVLTAPGNGESDTENYEFSFDQVTI